MKGNVNEQAIATIEAQLEDACNRCNKPGIEENTASRQECQSVIDGFYKQLLTHGGPTFYKPTCVFNKKAEVPKVTPQIQFS